MKITACLVLYNEEKVIKKCLESLKGVVDEINVVHDGECYDKTLQICSEYGAKIYIKDGAWRKSGPLTDPKVFEAIQPTILVHSPTRLQALCCSSVRVMAQTWSTDGGTQLPWFPGLGKADAERGMTFATLPPTMFLVAHVDYVRTVRVLPLGPEEAELTVDWYVHRDVVVHPALNVEQLIAFASQVVSEDARACELNQAGIRCGRHRGGVLLEVEDYVYEFEEWERQRLEHGGR